MDKIQMSPVVFGLDDPDEAEVKALYRRIEKLEAEVKKWKQCLVTEYEEGTWLCDSDCDLLQEARDE